MLKIVLGCSIVAFGSFCGYFLSRRYRQRKYFFRQWYEFNGHFLNEISYYRRPIREFVSAYTYQGEFDILLHSYLASLSEGRMDLSEYTFLREDERTMLYDYFQMLGKGDVASQKLYFSATNENLKKWKNATEEEGKRYGDLYIKLGFLCGLFILILII